jgi:sensor histidine kinase YesM
MAVCRDDITKVGRFLLISVVGGSAISILTCVPCNSFFSYFIASLFGSMLWLFLWGGNSFLGGYLDKKLPWTEFPVRRFIIGVLVTISYSFMIVVAIKESYAFFLEGFRASIYFSVVVAILISFFLHSRGFLLSWRDAAKSAEKLQKENVIAKYESLKSQVNPHFLFNSLNALTNLVYEDPDKAVKFIKQLSEVYRYVLDTRHNEVVGIKEELHFLDAYLFLQTIRFGDNLKTTINITTQNGKVAPLALQMLIENAIKHNVVSVEDPLYITIEEQDGFINVANNLQKKSTLDKHSSALGLENICKRYEFLSDKKVEIIQLADKFIVKLPVIP